VWFVYGNTFFYSKIFTENNFYNADLWKIMVALIIYGYISMLVFASSIIGLVLIMCLLWSQGYFDGNKASEYQEQLLAKNNRQTIQLDEEYQQKF